MFVVIAGTNRPLARSRVVAGLVEKMLEEQGAQAEVLDLAQLPREIFDPSSYAEKPASFEPFQRAILEAEGIVTVVPEYNGSFPGVLKYFIDMLQFPESLSGVPAAFIGVAAGEWGGLRAVEQLEMIFQYRSAHLFGRRVFLKRVHNLLDAEGRLNDEAAETRLRRMAGEFVRFARAVPSGESLGGS